MSYISAEQKKNYAIQRPCVVCEIVKPKSEFNKYKQKCICCEDAKLYKCYKCKTIKSSESFKKDTGRSSDGLSGMCTSCLKEKNRLRNATPEKRVRSFFRSCLKRLHNDDSIELYKELGFTKKEFYDKFPIIPKGYDIDHCIPLSWFIKDTPISISCSLHNLQLLTKEENSLKNNKFYHEPSDIEYFKKCVKYIDKKYLCML